MDERSLSLSLSLKAINHDCTHFPSRHLQCIFFLFLAHKTPFACQCLRPGFRARQNTAAAAGFDFPRILRIHRVHTMMASNFTQHGGNRIVSRAHTVRRSTTPAQKPKLLYTTTRHLEFLIAAHLVDEWSTQNNSDCTSRKLS